MMNKISIDMKVIDQLNINLSKASVTNQSFKNICRELKASLKSEGLDVIIKSENTKCELINGASITNTDTFIQTFCNSFVRYYGPTDKTPFKLKNYVQRLISQYPKKVRQLRESLLENNKEVVGFIKSRVEKINPSTKSDYESIFLQTFHLTYPPIFIDKNTEQKLINIDKGEDRKNWLITYDGREFRTTSELYSHYIILNINAAEQIDSVTSVENFNRRMNSQYKNNTTINITESEFEILIEAGELKNNEYYLYEITSADPDQQWKYIGMTSNLKRRKLRHIQYAKTQENKRAELFCYAIGHNAFKFIQIEPEQTFNLEQASEREKELIAAGKEGEKLTLLNLSNGGESRSVKVTITKHNAENYKNDLLSLSYRKFSEKLGMMPETCVQDLLTFYPTIKTEYYKAVDSRIAEKHSNSVLKSAGKVIDILDENEHITVDKKSLEIIRGADGRQRLEFNYECSKCKMAGRSYKHLHKHNKHYKKTKTTNPCTGCNRATAPNLTPYDEYVETMNSKGFSVEDLPNGEARSRKTSSIIKCKYCSEEDSISLDKVIERFKSPSKGASNQYCKKCKKTARQKENYSALFSDAKKHGYVIHTNANQYENESSIISFTTPDNKSEVKPASVLKKRLHKMP